MKITKQLMLPLVLLFILAYARGQDIHYNYDGGELSILSDLPMDHAPEWPPKADVPAGLPDLPASLPNVPVGPPPIGGSDVVDDQLLDQDIRQAVDVQLDIDLGNSVRPVQSMSSFVCDLRTSCSGSSPSPRLGPCRWQSPGANSPSFC